MDIDLWQDRGVPVSQETALEAAQPHLSRSLKTPIWKQSTGIHPPPNPVEARNRAKSLVLEYFTLSHLESKTGSEFSS
jgi:hypothetical protein